MKIATFFPGPLKRYGSLVGLMVLTSFVGGAAPVSAQSQNPYDQLQRQRAQDVSRQGSRPEGVIPLLQFWRDYDWATPEVVVGELERLSTDRRLSPPRQAYVRALLAVARLRSGDPEASRRELEALNYITNFRVAGSFDNEGKEGFEREMGPESERLATWDPDSRYEGREREVRWRDYPSDTARMGYVNFDAIFRPNENVCAYAETFIQSATARPLSLWVGAGGAIKVWWNGEEVISDEIYRRPDQDRQVALVGAQAGYNRLLVKTCVTDSTWGFYLRVGDARGGVATGISADASEFRALPTSPQNVRIPRPLLADLHRLESAAEGDNASASALENLARFLAYTGADDPVERRAKQLAARAAEADPTVARLTLAANLADERGEAMRFSEQARQQHPNDQDALLLHARIRRGGPSPENAIPILRDTNWTGVNRIRAAVIHASILSDLGLVESARATLNNVVETFAAPGWIASRAGMADAAGRADEVIRLRQEVVAARYDSVSARRALAADAVRRGERDEAVSQLELLRQIIPDSIRNQHFMAGMFEALGDRDAADAAYRRARDLAPEDSSTIAAHARFQLRHRQTEAAADSLRLALRLAPQDAESRELLEQIAAPQERPDERFAANRQTLLARRVETAGFPTTTLQNLTVNTVFENGLGSTFRQFAAQAHDQEGTRQLRTFSIQFDPATQRVDVRNARVFRRNGQVLEATQTFEQQMGEPWYRIYYDTRALVVVFPDLEPGDSIEVQYRIDDTAHRNLFADYYGDLHFLQSFSPTRRLDYILITPASREFFFNEPELAGLEHQRTVEGDTRTDHFHATDIPAIRSEPGMPGMTEVAPYLHVSTYRTWEEVGRWWWGLIEDQLQVDDNLRQVVRDLVDDAPDLETKVQRIHNWVIRNTRYVGLEFGIHGYKPYRVPLIVQRGFGDCKDKASLLYTMFREAGIDARIVLVRTRRNGAIRDLPASLAVFDHAIAYVPELDLYLDGTAEHSGTRELPGMDQGVSVLVVGPNEARLARTPVLGPDRNRRVRQLTARVSADGSAVVDVEETVTGAEASSYRSRYAPEGTREERLERSLRNLFPGLVLDQFEMQNLDELESDIEIEYRANVPQFGQQGEGGARFTPSVMQDLLRNMARSPERQYPLDLGGTRSYSEHRVLELPRGHRASAVPSSGDAESPFGRLSLSVESDGRRVTSQTEFELRRDRISPEEYPAFRRWVEEADRLLRQRIQLQAADQ